MKMPAPQATEPDIEALVRVAVAAGDERKADDLKVLALGDVTHFTDYFVLCSGMSSRQVQAIADGMGDELREHKSRPLHVEGRNTGQWVLLDYGDFVIHVFHEERREFYGLDRLWADAPDVTEKFLPAGRP